MTVPSESAVPFGSPSPIQQTSARLSTQDEARHLTGRVAAALGDYLRGTAQVRLLSIRSMDFAEFLDEDLSGVIAVGRVSGEPRTWYVVFSGSSVPALVERRLGAPAAPSSPASQSLTEIERRLLARLAEEILKDHGDESRSKLTVEHVELSSHARDWIDNVTQRRLTARYRWEWQDTNGIVTVVFPASNSAEASSADRGAETTKAAINDQRGLLVDLRAILPLGEISRSTALQLLRGETIRLPKQQEVEIRHRDQLVATGELIQRNGQYGVCLEGRSGHASAAEEGGTSP